MKYIVLIFFWGFLAKSSLANYPYYFFDEKKTYITDYRFSRNILPQATAIVKEYYHVLKKLNPLHSEIIDLKINMDQLRNFYNQRDQNCYKTTGLCSLELNKLYNLAQKVDLLLLKAKQKHAFIYKINAPKHADSILLIAEKINKLTNLNYQLMHILEEQQLIMDTSFEIHSTSKEKMNQIILGMNSSVQMIISAFVPEEFKLEFDFLWENYIKHLEQYIVRDKNSKYLLTRLGDLNISWNSFHMKISKGNLPFPRKLLSIIAIQHNRWNSILKSILRR